MLMTDAPRSYSPTPRTLCTRHVDGTYQILLLTSPVVNGVGGYLIGASYKAPGGKWTRSFEHPQEWTDCGDPTDCV